MSKEAKLSLTLFSLTILLMAALMSGMIKSKHWKIKNIELNAEFKRVSSEQIRSTVAKYPERSFFRVNTKDVRKAIRSIPWINTVSITKKWPNTLIINISEHKAVAVWNDNQLLNENGEIFSVDTLDDLTTLPHIVSTQTNSQNVWDNYNRFNDIIKTTGTDISHVDISNRGSWNITLNNSITINLGSHHIDAKLVKLSETWQNLMKQNSKKPFHIDLRYTNGYVAKWAKSATKTKSQGVNIIAQQSTRIDNG